jgi:hypothetical protein
MEKKQLLKIGFDVENQMFFTSIVHIDRDPHKEFMSYQKHIGCRMIDIVRLSEDVCIIINDEGLLESNNPVFRIQAEDGTELNLAGTMLFAGNRFTEEGYEVDSLSYEHLATILNNLNIAVIGITK